MKQVLVVGGAGGLGSAVVKRLCDSGLAVVVAGRNRPYDRRVRHFYAIDATVVDWRNLYCMAENESGRPIDGMLFVAGNAAYGETALFPPQRARAILELNFWSCTAAALQIAKHWIDAERCGTFVAVLSIVVRRAVPYEAYYSASKAAAARFLECLDLEYGPRQIRFVPAFPGTLDTPFRGQADWYGLRSASKWRGGDVNRAAHAIVALLAGRRHARVIGYRERAIDLADRLAPGLYDRTMLRRRVAKRFESRRKEVKDEFDNIVT